MFSSSIICPQVQRLSSIWTNPKAEQLPICPSSERAPSAILLHLSAATLPKENSVCSWKDPLREQWTLNREQWTLRIAAPTPPHRRQCLKYGNREGCQLNRISYYSKQVLMGSWALENEASHPPLVGRRERLEHHARGQSRAQGSPFPLFVDKYWGWQFAESLAKSK